MKGTSSFCYHPGVSFEVSFKIPNPYSFLPLCRGKETPNRGNERDHFFGGEMRDKSCKLLLRARQRKKSYMTARAYWKSENYFANKACIFPQQCTHTTRREKEKMHNCRTRVKRNYFSLPFPYFYLLLDETGQSF